MSHERVQGFMNNLGATRTARAIATGVAVTAGFGAGAGVIEGVFAPVAGAAIEAKDPCVGKPNISKIAGVIACATKPNISVGTPSFTTTLNEKASSSLKVNIQMTDASGRIVLHPEKQKWNKIESYVPPKPGCVVETVGDKNNKDPRTQGGKPYLNGWKDNAAKEHFINDKTKRGDKFVICANGLAKKILGHRADGTAYDCHNNAIFAKLDGHKATKKVSVLQKGTYVVDWSLNPKVRATFSDQLRVDIPVSGSASASCRTKDGTARASSSVSVRETIHAMVSTSGTVVANSIDGIKAVAANSSNNKAVKKLSTFKIDGNTQFKLTGEITGKVAADCASNMGVSAPANPKKPSQPAKPSTSTEWGKCEGPFATSVDANSAFLGVNNLQAKAEKPMVSVDYGDGSQPDRFSLQPTVGPDGVARAKIENGKLTHKFVKIGNNVVRFEVYDAADQIAGQPQKDLAECDVVVSTGSTPNTPPTATTTTNQAKGNAGPADNNGLQAGGNGGVNPNPNSGSGVPSDTKPTPQ